MSLPSYFSPSGRWIRAKRSSALACSHCDSELWAGAPVRVRNGS